MSYTKIYAFPEIGECYAAADVHNAHRGAWEVWNIIAQEYCGLEQFPMFNDADGDAVWAMWKSPDMHPADRIVLLTTFDHHIVMRRNLEMVVDAFERFNERYPGRTTIGEQALQIRELAAQLSNQEMAAVGWNQTSVCSGVWEVVNELGYVGDEDDDFRNFDLSRDMPWDARKKQTAVEAKWAHIPERLRPTYGEDHRSIVDLPPPKVACIESQLKHTGFWEDPDQEDEPT